MKEKPPRIELPSTSYRAVFRRRLKSIPIDEGDLFPWRASRDPYVVLLSEVLLQRTRGPNVAKRFSGILARLPDPESLATTSVTGIARTIQALGLRKRAPLLQRLGRTLIRDFGGAIPRTDEELTGLPGVGRYGANAVRCFAYDDRVAIVDAGIGRVIRRCLDLPSEKRVNQDHRLWTIAQALLPRNGHRRHNLALLAVADTFCRSRPRCDLCPLLPICAYGRRHAGGAEAMTR